MRIPPVVLFVTLSALACRSGPHLPGAPFTGSSLLVPLSDAEEAHDALLRADLSRSDSVSRLGYAGGLATLLSGDVLYLRGGLPVLRGRLAAIAVATAEPLGPAATVQWQPVRAEVSADGASGFTYGYAIYGVARAAAPAVRIDRYIAVWRRGPAGWRIEAYAEMYGVPPAPLEIPAAAQGAALSDLPMAAARGPLEAVRAADAAFAADAEHSGTGAAFGRYAAEDAQVFSGPGEFLTGPAAIMQSFGNDAGASSLAWHPVAGGVSAGGDLAYTVGYAVYTARREGAAPQVGYSKYLTVWKRQRDGQWRYVVDGGSSRPATP